MAAVELHQEDGGDAVLLSADDNPDAWVRSDLTTEVRQ